MSLEIVFCTGNPNKVKEIKSISPDWITWKSLEEIGWEREIPETKDTIEGNSLLKAETVHRFSGSNCMAEDTGLEVEALNGAPGVYSARYAGEPVSADRNIEKLLSRLKDKPDRSARFKTVISLILNGNSYQFGGVCEGQIIKTRIGTGGFGYDPIFVPNGANCSFGEMSMEEKQSFSHRAKAFRAMMDYLDSLNIA